MCTVYNEHDGCRPVSLVDSRPWPLGADMLPDAPQGLMEEWNFNSLEALTVRA